MASPFPGMDPYLEDPAFWPDFHLRFINYWCEAIADCLPGAYDANLNEQVYLVEQAPPDRKRISPDVAVAHDEARAAAPTTGSAVVATLEPVTIPLVILDGPREGYIEILHRPDHTLVAVLELLSPTNKEAPGRNEYLAKRNALLYQKVHLVELDLLVGGRRLPLREPLPAGHYYGLVSRGDRRPDCQVYSWTVRQPLPVLPVPLLAPDPDLLVDLGAVFKIAFEKGRYQRKLRYGALPQAPLSDEDRGWAQEQAGQA